MLPATYEAFSIEPIENGRNIEMTLDRNPNIEGKTIFKQKSIKKQLFKAKFADLSISVIYVSPAESKKSFEPR